MTAAQHLNAQQLLLWLSEWALQLLMNAQNTRDINELYTYELLAARFFHAAFTLMNSFGHSYHSRFRTALAQVEQDAK